MTGRGSGEGIGYIAEISGNVVFKKQLCQGVNPRGQPRDGEVNQYETPLKGKKGNGRRASFFHNV